jgi:hypothetical protein
MPRSSVRFGVATVKAMSKDRPASLALTNRRGYRAAVAHTPHV